MNNDINKKDKPKKNRPKKNRLFKCINNYRINQSGKILFINEKIYKFKKYSRYLFQGTNEKGNTVLLSSEFIKRNFEEIIDKNLKKKLNEYYFK